MADLNPGIAKFRGIAGLDFARKRLEMGLRKRPETCFFAEKF
jgi:hypothetical protein